jgi:two-component system, LytTR family, response regulator
MTLRVVVADDEPLARRGIVARLATYPDVEVVEECGDGESALAAVRRLRPDLLFLDVQMPGMSGLEALGRLAASELPLIIFTTAYGEHALRAFEVHAIDYLLKPLDDRRFAEAVARARQMLSLGASGTAPVRFAIKRGNTVTFVPAADVEWIEGVGDYAGLHTAERTHLLREPLHRLEQRLDAADFVRIHRSIIVRIDRIRAFQPLANRDGLVKLFNGTELRVSRTYRDRLSARLLGR